jgi:hypothetical protein
LIAVLLSGATISCLAENLARKGFFGGFDLGAGCIERTSDPGGPDDSGAKLYMAFSGGYAFNPHLAAGVKVSGWNYQPDNTYGYYDDYDPANPEGEGLYQVLLFGRHYPFSDHGLFLQLGGGMARNWNNRYDEDRYKDGWAAETAIGYDLFISGRVTAVLMLGYNFGQAEDMEYQSITASFGIMAHQWEGPNRLP